MSGIFVVANINTPKPSFPETTSLSRGTRQRDTSMEMLLHHKLHQRGGRYRVVYKDISKPRPIEDVVFIRQRIAIFVDVCFWHCCPSHETYPKNNAEFW